MNLISLQTLQYPVSIYTVRAENPNTSYPDSPSFVPEGYAAVAPTPLPDYDRNTQKVIEMPPAQVLNTWKQVWAVRDLPADEQQKILDAKAAAVRKQRNALLMQSDWTLLPDAPVDVAAWTSYRQALRDVPAQAGFPFDVVWPTAPSAA
jgi:hypothetical protein